MEPRSRAGMVQSVFEEIRSCEATGSRQDEFLLSCRVAVRDPPSGEGRRSISPRFPIGQGVVLVLGSPEAGSCLRAGGAVTDNRRWLVRALLFSAGYRLTLEGTQGWKDMFGPLVNKVWQQSYTSPRAAAMAIGYSGHYVVAKIGAQVVIR